MTNYKKNEVLMKLFATYLLTLLSTQTSSSGDQNFNLFVSLKYILKKKNTYDMAKK